MLILLATTSTHKCAEIQQLLAEIPNLKLETLADYPATEAPDEDGDSMAQNAQIKAQFYAQHFGATVLADDSGLEVDALNGEPGIHSARWQDGSDADRMLGILSKMLEIEVENRGARYRCALCLATGDTVLFETEATCEGEIALEANGENGFGYDPIFGLTLASGADSQHVGKTMAQIPSEVKAAISHRARAIENLKIWLQSQLQTTSISPRAKSSVKRI